MKYDLVVIGGGQSDVMGSSFAKKGFAANSFSTRRHWG
jgi:hypothetical protein